MFVIFEDVVLKHLINNDVFFLSFRCGKTCFVQGNRSIIARLILFPSYASIDQYFGANYGRLV